jgi:hypothetical protein
MRKEDEMLSWRQYILAVSLVLLLTACGVSESNAAMSVPTVRPITASHATTPSATSNESVALLPRDVPTTDVIPQAPSKTCPVTRPPNPPFTPPSPWPAQAPGADEFWFGNASLWTALPKSGDWRQLALGEKFWWWSEEFDVSKDTTPDLRVRAKRLDGDAASFQVSEATNGYHESFNWAMLVGVQLASPGCWEFTGEYNGHQLSFILWIPPE